VVEYAFKLARKHYTLTLFNPAPVRGDLDSLLSLADIVTPNEGEAEMLKTKLVSPDQTIVTTLGVQGAEWRKGDASRIVPSFPVDVVDTVGGGDAFNGGLAVALAEGKSLGAAVRFANAVAGLAVTKRGAASSMPQRAEVEAFLSQQS
jgi:ribokinase